MNTGIMLTRWKLFLAGCILVYYELNICVPLNDTEALNLQGDSIRRAFQK